MAVQTKLEYLTNRDLFSNYYLENLLPESDTWKSVDEEKTRQVFEEIKEMYDDHKEYIETYKEDHLEDKFIRPIFKKLGFEYGTREAVEKRQRFPDYGLFKSDEELKKAYDKKEEEDFYKNAISIAEAKRWDRNLDKRGDVRDFTNPSHQVYVYLQETPVDWAILTNGREWRLYYSKTSHKLDSYLTIDLPTILENEDIEAFRYFYLFFRKEAFVEDKRDRCFLDRIYDQSNLFSQELGEDLKRNIYEAIRLLSEGFLEFPENDLDSEDDLKLIHDSSLIYLYRMIFVLYAESEGRDLLDTSNRIYNEDYSLNRLKQRVCDELEKADPKYKKWQSNLWDRLEKLFLLIDKGSKNRGIPEDELYIPAYNGGLFRTEVDDETSRENEFLQENKVGDFYLAEVIDLLTRHESQNGEGRVFVDYSSLDIRHLGSIYEGLLEYELNVASEPMVAVKEDKEEKWYSKEEYDGDATIVEELDEGEVYLTTDKGERKATGSYYTPEYIVQYIVENTLDPILDEIREDLLREGGGNFAHDFAERVFELKVLDPAMGSGHFLTNALDHLAREIVNAHEKQAEEEGAETVDESHDIHWARRQVAQKCIYGVDLNDMAVELAKVSLWLRTLAAQQPLAFLDHHLKTGNSLIGSDIEDIKELDSMDKEENGENTTLMDFGLTWKGTMEDLMDIYQDIIEIENKELEDIKEMEEKYHEFEHEPIRERLEAMANVHTAREFDVDVPESSFGKMAQAIDDEAKWDEVEGEDWFEEAQEMAGDKEFFHWKLAFPEVFYEEEGEKKEDAGFDVVMGNPPYGANFSQKMQNYLKNEYITSGLEYDSYTFFIESGISLLSEDSKLGYIIPTVWTKLPNNKPLRRFLLEKTNIYQIVDCGRVFDSAVVETLILEISKTKDQKSLTSIRLIDKEGSVTDRLNRIGSIDWKKEFKIKQSTFLQNDDLKINYDTIDPLSNRIIDKIEIESEKLGNIADITQGLTAYDSYAGQDQEIIENRAYHSEEKEDETYGKWLKGEDVKRFRINWSGEWISYGEWLAAPRESYYFNDPRLLFREVTGGLDRVIATYTDKEYYYGHSVIPAVLTDIDYSPYSLLAIVNSRLLSWYNLKVSPNAQKDTFPKMNPNDVKNLPIKSEIENEKRKKLSKFAEDLLDLKRNLNSLNLNLLDYLGISTKTGLKDSIKGDTLGDLYVPPSDVSNSKVSNTEDDLDGLRIEGVSFDKNDEQLIMSIDISYKPEDEEDEDRKTDRYGRLVESEFESYQAMVFTGLSEKKELLIKEFIPVVIEEDGGFANFRTNATSTISLMDRLEKLTLPKLSDVESGLEKYLKQKEKAERLEEEIRETDHTIDAIVFDLYDLTEEEVETVLDSLDTDEEEKVDIMEKFREINQGK